MLIKIKTTAGPTTIQIIIIGIIINNENFLWSFFIGNLFCSNVHAVTYFLITSSEQQFESSLQVLLQLSLCYTLDKQGHVSLPLTINPLPSIHAHSKKNLGEWSMTWYYLTKTPQKPIRRLYGLPWHGVAMLVYGHVQKSLVRTQDTGKP